MLNPQVDLADYELAIRNSVLTIWPCTVVCACLFHFEQAMLRNAASMGLAPFYKIIGSPVRRTIQLLGVGVYDVYHNIKPTVSNEVGEFFEYMESTWICGPVSPAKYLPSTYNGTSIPTA